MRGVTKPSTTRPAVMPIQKPVATMPESKAAPSRSRVMNTTIHPPSATSTPTYASRNTAATQLTRDRSASLSSPPLSVVDDALCDRNRWPVAPQKLAEDVPSSMAAPPICVGAC